MILVLKQKNIKFFTQLSIIILLISMFSININPAKAKSVGTKVLTETQSKGSLPGLLVIPKVSPTGVTITFRNLTSKPVSRCTVEILANSYIESKKTKKILVKRNILPLSSSKSTVSIPLKRTKVKYYITATTKTSKSTGYSGYTISSKKISNWDKGTFDSIRETVDRHYKKHGKDKYIKAANIDQYTRKATSFWNKAKKINKSTRRYSVIRTKAKGNKKAQIKVKDKVTKEYMLMHDGKDRKIFSYGGNG